jgi:hypothetical protein
MIQIEGTCSGCGTDLDLTPADLLLLVPVEAESRPQPASRSASESGSEPRLVFDCSECGSTCAITIESGLAVVLQAHGVAALADLELEPATAEPHPENPPPGPALTADDLIELHVLLERENWFDELAATRPPS